jgi:hypothetical protein
MTPVEGPAFGGEDGGLSPPSLRFGVTGMEDGMAGSAVAGLAGAKPMRNGGCCSGAFGGSTADTGFSGSGKFGKAGAGCSSAC